MSAEDDSRSAAFEAMFDAVNALTDHDYYAARSFTDVAAFHLWTADYHRRVASMPPEAADELGAHMREMEER